MSKLVIRNCPGSEGQLSKGANMEVLLDGKPIKGATFVKFEVKAAKLAKVVIELYAEVEIEAEVELVKPKKVKTVGQSNGKTVAIYELGNYSPGAVVYKDE